MGAYTTIDDPSAHFHIQLWTGNGSNPRNITNDANAGDFKPDLFWGKRRDTSGGHNIFDSSRGATKRLEAMIDDRLFAMPLKGAGMKEKKLNRLVWKEQNPEFVD